MAANARGQVMVLISVAMIAIMGMIGVVVDVGYLQHQRNMMQTAADSAAMAGAEELNYGDQVAAGKADAASNGYTNGQASVSVSINNPPSTGPNTSNATYVEAIVSKPEPTYFLRVLGFSSVTVSARAVASNGNGPNCIYVMDPSAASAMTVSGSAVVSSGCGLLVDSSSSTALMVGGSGTVTAPTIGVVGGYSGPAGSFTPTPKTGVIAASDPLAYLQAPTVGSCSFTSLSFTGTTGSASSYFQLYPGTYCGGITLHGNTWLHFNPGTYVLAGGGFSVNGTSTMNGTGVTFYNTTGLGGYQPLSMTGNMVANFSAPTSGPLTGILFFQDRATPLGTVAATVGGNAGSTYDGALYFPTTTLTYGGNSSVNGYSIIVADKVVVGGNSTLGINYSSLGGGSPIKGTVLVE
jgi:Flp pilus assembly protein TadG